ncbi:MAG: hypothetical protein IPM90_01555 [Austwickia sp.]|nr:hypothetical protein [Austwickia sp.]
MTETELDAPRIWVEFVDPDESAQRFRLDLTWLTSTHRCVFGAGCLGIYRDRPDDGCCTLGAEFTGPEDLARVSAAVQRLDERTWQLRQTGHRLGWHEPIDAPDDAKAPLQQVGVPAQTPACACSSTSPASRAAPGAPCTISPSPKMYLL